MPTKFTRREAVGALLKGSLVCSTGLIASCAGVGLPGLSDIDTLMREGEELYRAKRYDEAIAKFKQVVARQPTHFMAWLWLCRTYIVKLLWRDAIDAGRQAFQLSPQGPEVLKTFLEALFGGGLHALTSGNFRESITHFGEYLKLDGNNGSAWLNVGKAYLGNQQFGEALKSLLSALGISGVDRGDVLRTMFSGGLQAFNARDFNSTIGFMREYVKQDPRNLQAYVTLARSFWETGQTSNALSAVGEALRISPSNGEALQLLQKLR